MRVGYIGLGAMGTPLARRLLRDGRRLLVWDLDPAAVERFRALGADAAASAVDLARRCDIVLLCLPRSADVETVLFGANGLSEGLAAGKVVVDQTSGIPSETRKFGEKLAARGVTLIDAPVSGGAATADNGTIAIMTSGSEEGYARALPVLKAISSNVFRCGALLGSGQAVKAVNNMMMACNRLSTLELVALGRKMGLSLEAVTRTLNRGSGHNHITNVMLPALQQGKGSNSFFMSLMVKDINQAIALGSEVGAPMPIANVARAVYQVAVNTLGERSNLDDIAKLVESMAGLQLRDSQEPPGHAGDGAPAGVGYVGLGEVGGAVVDRLLRSRKVTVFDADRSAVERFKSRGAAAAPDPTSLARSCDVVIVRVPASRLRDVVFGPQGLAHGLSRGKILIDQTAGDPIAARRMASELEGLGVETVDASIFEAVRGAGPGPSPAVGALRASRRFAPSSRP